LSLWQSWWQCHQPLIGKIGNATLNDTAITASSYWQNSGDFGLGSMWRSRLDNEQRPWLAEKLDHSQWIQWNFTNLTTVTKIVTKGDPMDIKWVRSYRLSYTDDGGQTWEWYPRLFRGNWGPDSLRENKINPAFNATAVRLHPWNWMGHIALRAELYGCSGATMFPSSDVPWSKCADEGQTCHCKGVVYYGFRRRQIGSCLGKLSPRLGSCSGQWKKSAEKEFLYTDSSKSIVCNASMFKERSSGMKQVAAAPNVARSCGCLGKDFIAHLEETKVCSVRRRGQEWKNKTTAGAARRRRLCGYGPVACVWNSWSNFSECVTDEKGESFKMRTRAVVQEPYNGGPCKLDHLKEKVTCDYPNWTAMPGCNGDCTIEVVSNGTDRPKTQQKPPAKTDNKPPAKAQVSDAG